MSEWLKLHLKLRCFVGSNPATFSKYKISKIMENVSLEVAKLLKEKGFNEPCEYCIETNIGTVVDYDVDHAECCNSQLSRDYISCPTFYQVLNWLKKYNCYVEIRYESYKTGVNILVRVLFFDPNGEDYWSDKSTGLYGDNSEFKTEEEALNFGILEALKRI